ncbi:hypothetical protein MNBD_GAMMA10-3345 [hydrothermal vent metagenome]|uniref:Uncharacterized protein n=1 Tax=hydrothermal vent metagenome TaxID=652676 RepID=A0A3B0XCI3_9ZZZZ
MGEPHVLESIRDCVRRCKGYSIRIEKEVVYYLYHMYTLDFDFDQNDNEWAKQILQQKNLPVQVRLDKINQHFRAQAMHSNRLSR